VGRTVRIESRKGRTVTLEMDDTPDGPIWHVIVARAIRGRTFVTSEQFTSLAAAENQFEELGRPRRKRARRADPDPPTNKRAIGFGSAGR
jgi:hypothetical protein